MARQPGTLTPRQARFVDEYLVDLKAGPAIVRSGYSGTRANQAALRMMRRPAVQAALAERKAALARKTEVTIESVIEQLRRIARFDVRQLYAADGRELALHELPAEIASVVEIQYDADGIPRPKPPAAAARAKAEELLGKHLGAFEDRHHVRVDGLNWGALLYLPDNGRGPAP